MFTLKIGFIVIRRLTLLNEVFKSPVNFREGSI